MPQNAITHDNPCFGQVCAINTGTLERKNTNTLTPSSILPPSPTLTHCHAVKTIHQQLGQHPTLVLHSHIVRHLTFSPSSCFYCGTIAADSRLIQLRSFISKMKAQASFSKLVAATGCATLAITVQAVYEDRAASSGIPSPCALTDCSKLPYLDQCSPAWYTALNA